MQISPKPENSRNISVGSGKWYGIERNITLKRDFLPDVFRMHTKSIITFRSYLRFVPGWSSGSLTWTKSKLCLYFWYAEIRFSEMITYITVF